MRHFIGVRWALILAAPWLCLNPAIAYATQAQLPILLHAEVALDVDPEGRVAAVEISRGKVPAALIDRVDAAARQWRFQPLMRDGKAVNGRTYARMEICLVPNEDEYQVAIDYRGNGPGFLPPRNPKSTILPVRELARHGIRLEGKIRYRVGVDGRAVLEYAELSDPELKKKYGDIWRRQQSLWMAEDRYRPEQINGVPVATLLEVATSEEWAPSDERKRRRAEYAMGTQACRVAAGSASSEPTAVDSPFRRLPES